MQAHFGTTLSGLAPARPRRKEDGAVHDRQGGGALLRPGPPTRVPNSLSAPPAPRVSLRYIGSAAPVPGSPLVRPRLAQLGPSRARVPVCEARPPKTCPRTRKALRATTPSTGTSFSAAVPPPRDGAEAQGTTFLLPSSVAGVSFWSVRLHIVAQGAPSAASAPAGRPNGDLWCSGASRGRGGSGGPKQV